MRITLEDILAEMDPKIVAAVNETPNMARLAAYAAIDRMPARWGTFGKFLFRLFLRKQMRELADRWTTARGGGP